ncbi:diguanylate cyclase [Heliorestis acidaminivorans]|uniref:Stage 0 sporulation protein A homolog n=1 Tax=Heliorestis acidaminivorans TaxID=553427 RepID=A0A6I0F0H7_9FIRM|nr:diguanylate cyclase [Heliorestis acidaminivorans]KAB2953366.1 diguanylate cyclase [Heliorestis acidaminivorans]
MKILIIDGDREVQAMLQSILHLSGYKVITTSTLEEAVDLCNCNVRGDKVGDKIDLVLMDLALSVGEVKGSDALADYKKIKSHKKFKNTPVIMMTGITDMDEIDEAFHQESIDYITKPIRKVDLIGRVRSVLSMKSEMDSRQAREKKLLEVTRKLEEAVQNLEQLSSYDALTGIANRRYFDKYLKLMWNRCSEDELELSLLMIDLDFFKDFNDTYGHQSGDSCLQEVASAFQSFFKVTGSLVCRYGGEEFAVILPDTAGDKALTLAEEARHQIEQLMIPHRMSSISDHVTVSIGLATTVPSEDVEIDSAMKLIDYADKALYMAKGQGRNQVMSYEEMKCYQRIPKSS